MFEGIFAIGPGKVRQGSKIIQTNSDGGDEALRPLAISEFVSVMDEPCRVRLDARKVHFRTTLNAINLFVPTPGFDLPVWRCAIIIVIA
jgi:hypothetical protein